MCVYMFFYPVGDLNLNAHTLMGTRCVMGRSMTRVSVCVMGRSRGRICVCV